MKFLINTKESEFERYEMGARKSIVNGGNDFLGEIKYQQQYCLMSS